MEQDSQPIKNNRGKKVLLSLLVLLLIGVAGGGSYWWRDKSANETVAQKDAKITSLQQNTDTLTKQLADEKAKNKPAGLPIIPACVAKAPAANVIEDIKASITSGNTAALEGRMAASVNVITVGSGVAVAKTPTQAITGITSFIGDPTTFTWNFALPAATLSSYGQGTYKTYFPGIAVVGKSGTKQVISFNFDCDAKINAALMSPTEAALQ